MSLMKATNQNARRQASQTGSGMFGPDFLAEIKPLTGAHWSLRSAPPIANLMPYLSITRLFLLLFSILCFSPVAKAAEKSLYNKETAQKIDVSKLSILGPKASRFRYDKRLLHAAQIAADRARSRSKGVCWRYVKDAMVSAGLVDSRPNTVYAKQAANELTTEYGFRKIKCKDPFKAPIGSVLIYGGRGAGHIEFRTKQGFVSDFATKNPSRRPLIGVFVK